MMLFFSVFFIVWQIFLRIFASSMMVVSRCLSSASSRSLLLANSVKLMYSASSSAATFWAKVVLPTHGVPVRRMTRLFMIALWWEEILIACVCALVSWAGELVCGFRTLNV